MAKNTNDSADRRSQILDAALQLFSIHGVAGTSMRALADAVGIKAASLYNHFASKRIRWGPQIAL